MRKYYFLVLFFVSLISISQELNCKISVDYTKIGASNTQVFRTLENSLNEFANKTIFTDKQYKQNEKINCSMLLVINGFDGNRFETSIQIQSSRPVYNSTYTTPILNINDKDFDFQYTEFENLTYNPNTFDSNLTAVISFYAQIIIAMDAETFVTDGGDAYFQTAQQIAGFASNGGKGWSQTEKTQNRYYLITDLLSPSYKPYRQAMHDYCFLGLDKMNKDPKGAKQEIINAVSTMSKVFEVRPSAYLLRIFTDAKGDELVAIFSGGPSVPIDNLVSNLNKISPTNSVKWLQIKP